MKTPVLPHNLHLNTSRLALSIKAATIVLSALLIYHQDLTILINEALQSERMSHIIVIPFLLAYLVYRKRKMLKAVIPAETSGPARETIFIQIVGAMLCLLAFLLYWHGSYTFYPLEYHMVSLPLFVAGLTLLIFNTKALRVLGFPLSFLLFLTPPPLQIVSAVGTTLSTFSSEAAFNVLRAVGLPVSLTIQYGTPVIILERPEGLPFIFAIDIACAGIYSLTGFTIFAVFVAYIARGAIWKKATIFLVGFPLLYALNILRIIIIVLIGYQYGMEAAMNVFHIFGGWLLIFLGTLILLSLSEKIWKIRIFTTKPKVAPCLTCSQSLDKNQNFCQACGRLLKYKSFRISKRDLSKIAVILISASLITTLQVPVFALTAGPAEVIIQLAGVDQVSTQILPEISGYTIRFIYRDKRFEEITQQDASLAYAYIPTNKTEKKIWVSLEIGDSRSALIDPWEACLIAWPQLHGSPPLVTQLDLRDIQLLQNPPIIGRFFAFQQPNSNITQIVLYWFESALFNTGSTSEQKLAKISIVAFGHTPQDVPEIEDLLVPFGEAIVNYWQPIKRWSQITLTIAQHGVTFITIITTMLSIILIIQVIGNRREKKRNLKLYDKLALQKEKIILQATHEASQHDKPTSNAIASQYQKLTGKTIEVELLIEKLNEAEKVGLVRSDITSQEDEPILIWKSQIPF